MTKFKNKTNCLSRNNVNIFNAPDVHVFAINVKEKNFSITPGHIILSAHSRQTRRCK